MDEPRTDAGESAGSAGPASLSPSAQRVQDALRALGFTHEVRESAQPTRTAAEAARAVKCDVGQIA
jgi:signal recognition particle subunit SEC65